MKQTVRLKNEEITLDKTTGELLTHTKNYGIKVKKSEDFMLMYLEQLMPLFRIKQKRDIDVLFKLIPLAEYNSGRILIPQAVRARFLTELGMSQPNFSISLKNLIKAELISGTGGEYHINPAIFWKGTNEERQAFLNNGGALRFTIEFSQDGHTSKDIEALQPNENFDNELNDGDY